MALLMVLLMMMMMMIECLLVERNNRHIVHTAHYKTHPELQKEETLAFPLTQVVQCLLQASADHTQASQEILGCEPSLRRQPVSLVSYTGCR